MQQPDHSDRVTSTTGEVEDTTPVEQIPTPSTNPGAPAVQQATRVTVRFDWFAVGVIVIIAAIFAAATHLYQQPASSLVPAAVLSATGCGLLITGLRKLRTFKGVGLLEAALGGLLLALFQFIAALSFPGVTQALGVDQVSGPGFFTTWGLVAALAMLFSVIGATLGHLAFAPLRPLPARAGNIPAQPGAASASDEDEMVNEQAEDVLAQPNMESESVERGELTPADVEEQEELTSADREKAVGYPPARTSLSYLISILLLGLAPFIVGYVFAAAFDVALGLNRYDPGPFPTLRLLSTLLPWQVPFSINLQSLNLSLVWRIPLFFGNPSIFDVQAIEPFVLNAAGLVCALMATFGAETRAAQVPSRLSWRTLLLLEALLGLALVLPADLWIAFGLHGLLQITGIAVLLRTLQLLNPLTFTLNLITAPLVCMIVGAAIFRMRRNNTNYPPMI